MEAKTPEKNDHLVRRTACITLFVLVMGLFLALQAAALIAPGRVAEAANRIGWGGPAISLSEAQYRRTGSIEDLSSLCETSIRYGRFSVSETYLAELIAYDRNGETLGTLSARKDAGVSVRYAYADYIRSNYAEALYRNGKKEEALTFALANTDSYGAVTPLGYLADDFVNDPDRASDYGLIGELLRREPDAQGEEWFLICTDLYRIYLALGDEESAKVYEEKLLSQNH